MRLNGPGIAISAVLPESIHHSKSKARVLLRGGEDVRSVIIKLNHADGERSIEIVVHAAAERPGRAGVAGGYVRAEMRDADQAMHEKMQLAGTDRELRTEQNVEFAGSYPAAGFVVGAKIGLQAKPVMHVSRKRRRPAAAVGQSVAVQKGITDKNVAGRTFMAHAALGPTTDRENQDQKGEQRSAHVSVVPPIKKYSVHLIVTGNGADG